MHSAAKVLRFDQKDPQGPLQTLLTNIVDTESSMAAL